ncbi:MAG: hypothetical protein JW940_38945 [Polyangiaceae bacterium]|nr:hypothetical protein [Polyangiaceae bacterium]
MIDTVRQRRWAAIAAVVAGGGVLIGVAARYGLPLALLLTAGGLLVLVVWLLWTSLLSLGGETELTLEEALHLAAPRAAEEHKRAVLRTLKDLEYERRVGKLSEDDYAVLSARYREEAKALLLEVDRNLEAARRAAEQRLARHLGPAGSAPAVGRKARNDRKRHGTSRQAARAEAQAPVAAPGPSRRCERCGNRNALTLGVCADCNQPLAPEGSVLCPACPAVFDATLPECPTCGVRREGT